MIVTDNRVAHFVSEKIETKIYPPFTCIGLERGGEIVSGLVFNCFTGPSIEVTAAGNVWTRRLLHEAGRYAFGQLGCARMSFTTEQENVARLVERLGGKREGVLRDEFGKGRDGIVIGILEKEYKF